jgi:hypothetical protein
MPGYSKVIKNLYRCVSKAGVMSYLASDTLSQASSVQESTEDPLVSVDLSSEGISVAVSEGTATVRTSSADPATGASYPSEFRSFPVGSQITLTAVPAASYEFVRWNRNGEPVSTDNPALVTVQALALGEPEAVYTAVFQAAAST